jgi:cytochrome c oxidase assembly protein subunit 15
VVTAHLLGGFCTLSLLWLLAQRLGALHWRLAPQQNIRLRNLRPLLWLALALVVVQIALGGWVSANYAALACPDLPLCFQQWLPPADFRAGFDLFQHIGPNYLGGQLDNEARTAIHLSHRLGALLVTLTILLLGWRLWRLGSRQIQFWVLLLWGVLTVQLGLGISNILLALPLYVAVGHNAVGAVLLLTIISIVHHSYSARIDTNR